MTNSGLAERLNESTRSNLDVIYTANEKLVEGLSTEQIVALTLYGEARSEKIEGVVAVGNVIAHRVASRRWGSSWKDVCLARWQFSCWEPSGGWDDPADRDTMSENHEEIMLVAHALATGRPMVGSPWKECLFVAKGIVSGMFRDRVRGSTHYITTKLLKDQPPGWAKGRTPACVIWNHAFFANVP